jgi:diguanylate cyclase (GGDEF)-like protein
MPAPTTAQADSKNATPSTYAPFGQLVKMLLPSAGSLAIYTAADDLVWCSDGYERPDLRDLLERLRAAGSDTLAGRGSIEHTAAGVPAFVGALRAPDARPLGSLVLELGQANARYTPSMVGSMLRPVLDCLATHMAGERSAPAEERPDTGGLDLLLTLDENDREDVGALEALLKDCAEHLGCVLGALFIPDKNLALTCALDPELRGSALLDRTQRHLLAWAQLNNRPMVVNRVASASDVAPYKILSCPVRDVHARVVGLVALFRAASTEDFELRDIRILEFVSRKALGILNSQYDSLTGLVNRLIFERRVQRLLDTGMGPHSLLYLDVDRLERINAEFGLNAGDEVIQRVAEIVRRAIGPVATASRVDGDRFAIVLPDTDVGAAAALAEKILAAVAHLGYHNGAIAVPVTVSMGVIAAERHGRVAHALAAAELACKRAKEQGRNRVVGDNADHAVPGTQGRQQLAAATLQEALRSSEFRLEAQPIVGLRMRPGEIVGYELLVRMRDQNGELMAPDKFLASAERYELMPALDRWVLCSVIDILRPQAQRLAAAPYVFAINVSAQSLATRRYAEFALEQLTQAGLAPASFCFEIRESAAVNDLEGAEAMIRELSAAGCKVALDNFGYGMSSLAYLKRLPVHYLKIDGRFVRRMADDRIAASMVAAIAHAARTLGVATIAEHVETSTVAELLRQIDVDCAQGFEFGRPQALAGILEAAAGRSEVRLRAEPL